MNKKILLTFIVLLASLLPFQQAAAQTTHAHSATHQWKGIDVLDVLANPSNYPGVETSGIPVYLYNVGTGRFAVDGGDYGMEARLFYEDFGRQLRLKKDNDTLRIDPLIAEQTAAKHLLTCNVPTLTRDAWNKANTFSPTTIFDGYNYWSKWNFVRIPSEDAQSEFHTYYMYQKHDFGKAYNNTRNNHKYQGVDASELYIRFGAAYGEYCSDGTTTFNDGATNTKGCGYYVHLDDDRSVWTTAGNANNNEQSPWGNTTTVEVNGDQVTIDELYQWRIISEEEYEQVLEEEVKGINPSISSLVPDRDFTRNSNDFWGNWIVTSAVSATPESGEGRKGYSFGNYAKNKTQQNDRYLNEAWNKATVLKKVFNSIKNAKFGFMSLEGIGTVHTTFEIPHSGWYQVECRGISFAPSGHDAFMYAFAGSTEPDAETRNSINHAFNGYGEVELERFDTVADLKTLYPGYAAGTYKRQENLNTFVGKVLTYDEGINYVRKFWVYVSPEAYEQDHNFTIGFRKIAATKAFNETKDNINYYYDNDWIAVDNIKMSYMGLAPAFLYEAAPDMDYLIYDPDFVIMRPSASPDSIYSGALSLKRTLKKNQWNSFSLPIPLTGEQVRYAFGEDAELLELVGIGTLSLNPNVIDFRHVELKPVKADSLILVPGKFYLLKPTVDPVEGEDPLGVETWYYQLGRNFFSVKPNLPAGKSHYYVMDPKKLGEHYSVGSYGGANDGVAYVSYAMTPDYDSFTIDGAGVYQGDTPDSLYVPGSSQYTYAVYGNTIWELNRDMPIKGFRGWIILTNSVATTNSEPTSGLRMSIDGIVDGEETTGIAEQLVFPVSLPEDTNVYDLFGRRVGTLGMQLPKGIYIVKGKKFYVR